MIPAEAGRSDRVVTPTTVHRADTAFLIFLVIMAGIVATGLIREALQNSNQGLLGLDSALAIFLIGLAVGTGRFLQKVSANEKAIRDSETRVGGQMDSLRKELSASHQDVVSRFEKLTSRMERVEQRFEERIDRIDGRLDGMVNTLMKAIKDWAIWKGWAKGNPRGLTEAGWKVINREKELKEAVERVYAKDKTVPPENILLELAHSGFELDKIYAIARRYKVHPEVIRGLLIAFAEELYDPEASVA